MRRGAGVAAAGFALVASALLLAGCTDVSSAPAPTSTSSATVTLGTPTPAAPAPAESLGTPGAPGCAPASPMRIDPTSGSMEVQGTANAGESLYGLIIADIPLTASNTTTKFVWRMTGSGELTVAVKRPDGSNGHIVWGPSAHDDSTYNRPGEEWGTGIILDAPGCWEFVLHHGAAEASVYLQLPPEPTPAPTATPTG